ncbi:unnamed protein product [Acanthoscelides obtectus]|uniref:Notch ligand N-terminal domain-containing protein n=1 Tax=Acanthoscelides obtectus TaxID=200917 RepID=A0A9P0L0U8_ACAOB|nr:unnamed protein product [Acanthoscelides obtectus]CAK1676838.1 Protein serrate [Acanthoscelides obtectus]
MFCVLPCERAGGSSTTSRAAYCRLHGGLFHVLVLAFVVLAGSCFQCTSGSGIFELQVLEMSNPLSELSSGECCGGGNAARNPLANRCTVPCQTYFRLCLKEYQSNVASTGSCSFGNASSQVLGRDSFIVSDPDRGVGKIVLPFTFRWTVSGF